MASVTTTDLDFLAANIHGRRGRMAEGDRLDAVARLRTVPDLVRVLLPRETAIASSADLQRRLVRDLAAELGHLASYLGGPAGALLEWLRTRFEVENLKVLARGFAGGLAPDAVRPHLIALPDTPAPDPGPFVRADGFETFVALVPEGPLRDGAARSADLYASHPRSFALEAGLDRGYLAELLDRAGRVPDRAHVQAVVRQEVQTFQMMLVARGRFTWGLEADDLAPFGLVRGPFERMLSARDLAEVARAAVGQAIDRLSKDWIPSGPAGGEEKVDAPALEALAWDRYRRLANWTFRRSHMGLGAVVAYTALRRVELANLIRVSEGIRLGVGTDAIRRLLIPQPGAAA